MRSPLWTAARALPFLAAAMLVPAAAIIAQRSSMPCGGTLREIFPTSGDGLDALPIVAQPSLLFLPTQSSSVGQEEERGTYQIGSFRLHYWRALDRGEPAGQTWFDLEDPRSCDGGTLGFTTGRKLDRSSLALRVRETDPAAPTRYVFTWHDAAFAATLANIDFTIDPPGALRSLPRYRMALVVLLLAAAATALAFRRASRARPWYAATWRAGQVDERGWIIPEDGSAEVPAMLSGFPPDQAVVFSTAPARRGWTFRDVGAAPATSVMTGTYAEVAGRHRALARSAVLFAAAAALAGSGVFYALLR